MIEDYMQAIDEFKRVDHLYHVSLKYTRTVDVIRSMIERLISTYEFSVNSLLKIRKEEQKISQIPDNPVGKTNLAKQLYTEEVIIRNIDLYLKLRKLMRAPYGRKEEFRRHVAMIIEWEGEEIHINIDLLKEYYDITREFLSLLKEKIEPYKHLLQE